MGLNFCECVLGEATFEAYCTVRILAEMAFERGRNLMSEVLYPGQWARLRYLALNRIWTVD